MVSAIPSYRWGDQIVRASAGPHGDAIGKRVPRVNIGSFKGLTMENEFAHLNIRPDLKHHCIALVSIRNLWQ